MKKITDEEIAKIWCFHNDIKIYAVPISNSKVKIEINNKGIIVHGTKEYYSSGGKTQDDKWWIEIEKLYVIYYKKHNP